MRGQRRGQETKERLLESGCKVFAEKGYRDATHADICEHAGANVAAINYYFGSKEDLYAAVFTHLVEKAAALYPLHGGLEPDSPPEERLRAFVHAHLHRMFDTGHLEYLHAIRMSEMFDSTGLLAKQMENQLAADRGYVLGVLRELLGPDAPEQDVVWCEMSIVSQCFVGAPRPGGHGPRTVFQLDASQVDRLTEHIMAFSMAGVMAIRKRLSGAEAKSSAKVRAKKGKAR